MHAHTHSPLNNKTGQKDKENKIVEGKKTAMKLLFLLPLVLLNQIVAVSVDSNTLFFLADDSKTVMGYDGALRCPLFKNFCAYLVYFEIDTGIDDMVKQVPTQCTDTGVLYHNAAVVFKGGDGPGQVYYEPGVKIFHNCAEGGFIWQMTHTFPAVAMRNRWVMMRYSLNLTATSEPKYHNGPVNTSSFKGVTRATHPNLYRDDSRRFTREDLFDNRDKYSKNY
ncbi:hypothetical protein B9Z55_025553 [Caenorhabditis nigoni]|uniref:Uncharacterized protein n=1 Tax=Caenorhabditis nigoni TaxID=1611254 RepID=A0A2G5SZA2_9PELO|nr:hypothetical protein B9Z55_025553 [Caenorhabditis nigoni]